jgi:hypothetical protein
VTVHKIRSKVLREAGHKVESYNLAYITARLEEVRERDPHAKIITLEVR